MKKKFQPLMLLAFVAVVLASFSLVSCSKNDDEVKPPPTSEPFPMPPRKA